MPERDDKGTCSWRGSVRSCPNKTENKDGATNLPYFLTISLRRQWVCHHEVAVLARQSLVAADPRVDFCAPDRLRRLFAIGPADSGRLCGRQPGAVADSAAGSRAELRYPLHGE